MKIVKTIPNGDNPIHYTQQGLDDVHSWIQQIMPINNNLVLLLKNGRQVNVYGISFESFVTLVNEFGDPFLELYARLNLGAIHKSELWETENGGRDIYYRRSQIKGPKVSVCIVTLETRWHFFNRLMPILEWQRGQLKNPNDVEFVVIRDNRQKSTGAKRNEAVQKAKGIYVVNFDDDDLPNDCYLKKMVDAAESGMDCASLIGLYFLNGVYDRPFLHSNKYTHWYQDDKFYYRTPNHISLIKRDIALQVPYEDITCGEDGRMSEQLKAKGLIKTEYEIKETLYFYFDRSKLPNT